LEGGSYWQSSGAMRRVKAKLYPPSLRGGLATKQSMPPHAALWIASLLFSPGT
jgi:hypothetical protein